MYAPAVRLLLRVFLGAVSLVPSIAITAARPAIASKVPDERGVLVRGLDEGHSEKRQTHAIVLAAKSEPC